MTLLIQRKTNTMVMLPLKDLVTDVKRSQQPRTFAVAKRFESVRNSSAVAAADEEAEAAAAAAATAAGRPPTLWVPESCCWSPAGFVNNWANVGAKLGLVRPAPDKALCRMDPAVCW